jgi:ferredoxin
MVDDILSAWADRSDAPGLPVLPDQEHDQEPPAADLLPALMLPFRDPHVVRDDYPLFLHPPGTGGNEHIATPLSDLFCELAEQFAPGADDARILKDNFLRLERCVRESLDGAAAPVEATSFLSRAAAMTEETLQLRGPSGERFHEDLEKLVAAVPQGGSLLAFGAHTPLQLFVHLAVRHAAGRRTALEAEVAGLRDRLRDRLRLDDAQQAGRGRPEALRESMGDAAEAHVEPEALARIVGTAGGTEPMPAARRERIHEAIGTFDRFVGGEDRPPVLAVHHDEVPETCQSGDAEWWQVDAADVCRRAAALFDEVAAGFASLFATMRLARLELADTYDPARHGALREIFDWRSFSREELASLPPVVALESAAHLAGRGMLDLSRLLLAGRPVNVLVTVDPATNPGLAPDDDPLAGFRFELGYLAVSHREALVNQSSAARPAHLLRGFRRALDGTRAALHVVASGLTAGGGAPPLGGWLHAGAALEGRAHPLFHYDPEAGNTWARRLDFSENPHPESDWPQYTLPCRSADGGREDLSLAFTFADFALMEPGFRRHFRALEKHDEPVTLDEYLSLPPEETQDRVPFIWAADAKGRLRRLAVSRPLAFACRDRLDYWHTLQELAGVRSEYVREALARQREELETAFDAERKRLGEEHAAELERVREEATGDAMRRLAEALLATDISSLETPAPAPVPTEVPETPVEVEAKPEPEPEAEVEVETEEPWIETALCTSCNDCLDINPRLFVYNDNKQAVFGDLQAGTYDEIVRAAEKCPARCIHPGLPLNPDEPNLEALVERA